MTLNEFNDLDQAGKSLLLAHLGVIIGERNETTTTYTLFHMGSFYAEACYDVKESKLVEIRSFVNTGPPMYI
ncbi:hypothetical protein EXU57_24440 [Segetibacter sp. 3557_3]|uniref:hypothetical protein n=1 Tax=Segetibacter sp. 3557_3 TaxID=2547429 RepID=UPI001058ADC6|nr:hypothetical protein [Segetibacter sp. 3557_3]TDH18073.1 hypothetical protein EXU57_24440 [Segetibacter sp. 3557_3]